MDDDFSHTPSIYMRYTVNHHLYINKEEKNVMVM